MKKFLALTLAAAALLLIPSCSGSKKHAKLLPSVSGKAGEVIIVMNKGAWEGNLGGEVRGLLACDCPYLYQKEPLYSLVNVPPSSFTDLFKVHRNIVIFNIDPQGTDNGVSLRNDVWAKPQCVIQVAAPDEESAIALVKEKGEVIEGSIEQAERDRVIGNTLLYEEKEIAPKVAEVFGGSPHFPTGYKLRKITSDFAWIAYEKQYSTQTVLVYKYPAAGNESDFSEENIIAHRNSVMMNNVPGMFENTYMTTSEYIQPTVKFVKYKGLDFAQTRGFWEVHNDYMGGPFVSHSFYSQDGKDIIVLEAFVYAPKYDKRQYLRQTESLLYSFEWKEKKD